MLKNVLFVYTGNKDPSSTSKRIHVDQPDMEVKSAGTSHYAATPVTKELIIWSDIIVVMEKYHRNLLKNRFYSSLIGKEMIVLDIQDEYDYMQEDLIDLIKQKSHNLINV